MKSILWFRNFLFVGMLLGVNMNSVGSTLYGPTPYLSSSDSPFTGTTFEYFYLEDFEDHQFNTPGVSASAGGVTSVISGPDIHDSVDADDGVIDGSGLAGDSYYFENANQGIRFSFDQELLGFLPTHVGIVWTDGAGLTTFEAFDAELNSLGVIAPEDIAASSYSGETDEDRFFGVFETSGVASILIRNSELGIEVDHLQYGYLPVSSPSVVLMFGLGMGMLGFFRKQRDLIKKSTVI